MSYLIKRVVRTAKTEQMRNVNKYVIDLDINLNKSQIKQLFKKVFDVDVIKINTSILPLKKRRTAFKVGYSAGCKRAIIKLSPGQSLPFFS